MSSRRDRTPERTRRLDRERILDVAMRIVDREGMAALSMRRLGTELKVDPMAIYYHLPSKQAIIAGLVQRVFEDIARSAGEGSASTGQERVREWAMTYHHAARSHANLIVYLVSNADAATDSVMQANDILYAALSDAGMPARDVVRSADMIVDYIHGVVLGDTTPARTESDWRRTFFERLNSAPSDRFTALRQVFGELEDEDLSLDVEYALDVLIAGLEHRIPST